MSTRLCSVSIDLDPIDCYYRIHGLGEPPAALRDVILRRALPRFVELFGRRRVPVQATFFVVGRDAAGDPGGRARLRQASEAGHELGNHSHTHPYALARLPREEIVREVGEAHRLLEEIAGRPPVGFRAPGYDMSERLWEVLAELGYRYDSSIFPSWPYYAAKAGVMLGMALFGRRSESVMVDPRSLVSPTEPYRPGRASPFRRGDSPLVELPISTTRGLRLPVIGTSVLGAPPSIRTRLVDAMSKRSFFNFELHGIDLIGAEEDGIPAELVSKQHDLRVPLVDKLRTLEETLDRLDTQGYAFQTLRDVAAGLDAQLRPAA
jgi:peptidoglycan/xylan/chitin deacetylase (PgdA/CDA1 family)